MDKIYFRGLNGIRAIAALIVITFHIDQGLGLFGLPSFGYHKTGMAGYGVSLFFVLSGFLITHLLLIEKYTFAKIDISKFYMRRIFRIWPIYYLIIILTIILVAINFFTIPGFKVPLTVILYSFLLSNVGYAFGMGIASILPLWSVGVEEQFYAFWPHIVSKSKNMLYSFFVVIALYMSVKIFFRYYDNSVLYRFITLTSFDSMAIGGIAAYLVFTKNKIMEIIYHPLTQFSAWIFFAFSIFHNPVHLSSIIDSEMHSVYYAVIIVNVSTNARTIINLENKILNFLGRISYGMYIYHMTILCALSQFMKSRMYLIENKPFQYALIYILVITVTILISYLSYRYFERIFMNWKTKYSKVSTTD